MRRLFTTADAEDQGISDSALKWGEKAGRWRRIQRGVYGEGPTEPNALDRERARVLACNGIASGNLVGVMLGLDSVQLDGRPLRRRDLDESRIRRIAGMRCTNGLQTILDLAATMDDLTWEQALESVLRRGLATSTGLKPIYRTWLVLGCLALRASVAYSHCVAATSRRPRACWRR